MAERFNIWKPKTSKFFYCRFTVGGHIFRGSTKKTSRAEAIAFVKEWKRIEVRKYEDTDGSAGANLTLLPAVERYVQEFTGTAKRLAVLERQLDWLVDEIGPGTRLVDIDNNLVAKLCARRAGMYRYGRASAGKVSSCTVGHEVVTPLSGVMWRAKRMWGVSLPHMPDFGMHVKRPDPRERELSLQEEFRIMRFAGDYRDILEFALLSGLRRAELPIKWNNVLWELNRIRVKVKGGMTHEVLITPGIRRLLEANRGRHDTHVFTVRKEGLRYGENLPERPAGSGIPIEDEMLFSAFRHFRRKSGVTNLTIHDLRRTAGSRKYRSTGDIGLVAQFLGHRDIKITRKHYVHIKLNDVSNRIIAAEALELATRDRVREQLAE
ncbi:tyrosine-type recombinase/integrase [Methylobacterium sp. V23]|uniref:site-specific integrase n=1 Tax=Methylobacterium sp. V23 TaxID=2044878 RepID=UPI0015E17967|nr:tyrosine-type recombinase/integrase [Methylobacterium sp. V23]